MKFVITTVIPRKTVIDYVAMSLYYDERLRPSQFSTRLRSYFRHFGIDGLALNDYSEMDEATKDEWRTKARMWLKKNRKSIR